MVIAYRGIAVYMLTHFEIATRESVLDHKIFGGVGTYEQLTGSAFFVFDPAHAANAAIVDLTRAARNDAGLVECRADIWVLQPVDRTLGNGNLLYYVVNRGRKGALSTFNLAEGSNAPKTAAQFGDGMLLEAGYVVAACAWQADVPPEFEEDVDLLTLDAPLAQGIEGPLGCEILVDEPTRIHSLGSRYHRPYEVAAGSEARAQLTVREEPHGEAKPVAREAWQFARFDDGRPAIQYEAGFIPGLIYNLVYTGRDPVVMGTGMAVTRDFVSNLKYAPDNPSAQHGRPTIARAYGFGSSQSGRFLRHLLYQGFNADEEGRQVFDALQINVAGGGMGSFNHRFAQPSRHASAHFDAYYPTEQFPFADAPQQDPHTKMTEGLLDACERQGTTPKIFYINSSTEYWNRGASLTHADAKGNKDLTVPAEVRIYHFAGTQHGAADLPNEPDALPGNPVDFRLGHRALLQALDRWVQQDIEPPQSCYGKIADGTLLAYDALQFPALPGMPPPKQHRQPRQLDHGPEWARGIIGREPPGLGDEYAALLPAVDIDGNEIAGIRLPEVAIPLGTFVGWRLRSEAQGATWAIVGLQGGWLPFAATDAERDAQDPRDAIATRYRDRQEYIERAVEAAEGLVGQRLLLSRDLGLVAERAGHMYDWAFKQRGRTHHQ